jgi:hypothetical protein
MERHKGTGTLAGKAQRDRYFGELRVLWRASNPLRAGEETRAKDAKDAKVKGMKDEEIGGVVVEGAFALRIQMPCG